MTHKTYQEAHLASFLRLPVEMRTRCVEAIRDVYQLHQDAQEEIVGLIKENPETWWAPYHFGWGMSMRNFLREYFTDDKLPPTVYNVDSGEAYQNWDDYYIGVVEVAFKEGIYHLLGDDERV